MLRNMKGNRKNRKTRRNLDE